MNVLTHQVSDALGSLGLICSNDSETTGLFPYKGDQLFSLIISTEGWDYYLNFKDYPDRPEKALIMEEARPSIDIAFKNPDRIWFMQNAKFDLKMYAREQLFIKGKIYDCVFLDRIYFNQHKSYKLKDITKRWGDEKLDIVWNYIEEHKLFETRTCPLTGREEKRPCFEKVPFDIIMPYGEQDGAATLNVGQKILAAIKRSDADSPDFPPQMAIVENEAKLVHTLFSMEHVGIKIDQQYCLEAYSYYADICDKTKQEFKALTGIDFVKGDTVFQEVFASEKNLWVKTEKGNWRWDADLMATLKNPAARIVESYAEAKKQHEYFENLIYFADPNWVIHPDYKQAGTVTGRMSCENPNLQNLTNPDKYDDDAEATKYPVRRAFIPRDGFYFASLDYDQIEFRVMLDICRANRLIKEVLAGKDVHTATADLAGCTRKDAKTVNFLTIYGGGVAKLTMNLFKGKTVGSQAHIGAIFKDMNGWRKSDVEVEAAKTLTQEMIDINTPLIEKAYGIQQSIFRAAPEMKDTMKAMQRAAETRGWVFNQYGRRYQFPDKRFAYSAPNHIVQGTSADILKFVMNEIHAYLADKESRLLLTIHDELVFEIRHGEEFVIEGIKTIMENFYKYRALPLTVGIEFSMKSLADLEPWPLNRVNGKETGNSSEGAIS